MPDAWGQLDGVPEWFATLNGRLFYRVGDVTVIDRDAFIPTLCLQLAPVDPAPRNVAINGYCVPPILMPTVEEGAVRPVSSIPADDSAGFYFWVDWPHRYDYLLIMDFGDRRNPVPAQDSAGRLRPKQGRQV